MVDCLLIYTEQLLPTATRSCHADSRETWTIHPAHRAPCRSVNFREFFYADTGLSPTKILPSLLRTNRRQKSTRRLRQRQAWDGGTSPLLLYSHRWTARVMLIRPAISL